MSYQPGYTQTIDSTLSTQLSQAPKPFQKSTKACLSVASRGGKTDRLVIVDANLEDGRKLLKGIVPGAKVMLLDTTQDGVQQITQALRESTDLLEIHIISHGSPGCLQLGNTQLNLDTLERYADELQTWKVPHLILYGCNVAAGDAGIEFIEKLHHLTGAKIAASANKTGYWGLGGDWKLEVKTDEFEVSLALTPEAIANYYYTFALPIASLTTQEQDAEESTIVNQGITYNFGQGSNLEVTSFETEGGVNFLSAGILNDFELRRVDQNQAPNAEPDRRQIIWYELLAPNSTNTNLNLAPERAVPSEDGPAMETALFSEFINRGTDNIFSNQGNRDGNVNNIERVDYISTSGLPFPEDQGDLDGIGFLILERGGNDPFKIAAITAIDEQGNPTAYGDLLSFPNNVTDWGISDTGFRAVVLRQEEGEEDIARTIVPRLDNPNTDIQNIAGIFVSYEDLLGAAPTSDQFFGYSLFPPDIDETNDLVGLSDFPLTTSDQAGPENQRGGLDLVGGGVVYRASGVNIPPEAADDTAIINPGETEVSIPVLANDIDRDNSPQPISIVETGITTPANGTVQIDDNGTPDTTDDVIVYTPEEGFTGPEDTFDYTITDGADEATATVTITFSQPVGGTIFTDTNSNNILDPDEGGLANITVNLVDGEGNVVATIETDADGNYQFDDVVPGDYTVEVDTEDPDIPDDVTLETSTAAVTVGGEPVTDINFGFFPPNEPPVAGDVTAETRFDSPTDPFPLDITDPDDNEDLTTIDLDPTTPDVFETTRTIPERGTFTLEVVENEPLVTFAPAPEFLGSADPVEIDYTVQDTRGAISEPPGTISVTVNPNQPPVANDVRGQSTLNINPISLPLSPADFNDPDGTVETVSLTLPPSGRGILVLDGVVVSDPAQVEDLTPDQLETITFQPNQSFVGDVAFTYTVTDNDGATSDDANITIPLTALPAVPSLPQLPDPITNLPPEAQDLTETITNDGTTADLPQLTATDPDGTVDFFNIVELPSDGTLFLDGEEVTDLDRVQNLTPEQAGQLSFLPDPDFVGETSFTFAATDNEGALSNVATVQLNVEEDATFPPNEPVDDGECDCPPLPEFGAIEIPDRPDAVPNPPDIEQPIIGSDTDEILRGTSIDDTLFSAGENAVIIAFEGNDTVFGNDSDQQIFADRGNDSLFGELGNDTIIGTDGDGISVGDVIERDIIYGNEGNDLLQGGPGNDTIFSGEQDDFTYGGQDRDILLGDLGNDTLYGDEGDDSILGDTVDEDEIDPQRGLDGVIDLMWGGAGDDSMNGGRGTDTLSGGRGNDDVRGGKEDDLVYGEVGDDLLYGDLGNDQVCGGDGNDTVFGDINDSEIFSDTPGEDTLCGGTGDDILYGNQDTDLLCGDEGGDTLYGGLAEDTLYGELGNDWLFGDEADDLLFGGSGADRFVLFSEEGTDTIGDFQLGTDFIALGGGLTFEDLTLSQDGTSTIISLDNRQLAILNTVQASALSEDSFTALAS